MAQPATLLPPQLDHLVQRIALYSDPLLAQVLTASTYWDQIPGASAWANQHSWLKGDAPAQAIRDEDKTLDETNGDDSHLERISREKS